MNHLRIVPILVLALTLAACAGATQTQPDGAATTPTADPGSTIPVVVATSAPTTAPEQATTAPADPAQATAQPTIASQPTDAVAGQPTTTPLPAMTVSPQEVAGVCAHRYYPIKVGTSWTYITNGTGVSIQQVQTITDISEGANGSTAKLTNLVDTMTVENEIACTASGLQLGQFSGVNLLDQAQGLTAIFETIEREGVYLPPDSQLTPGATWDARYKTKGKMNAAGQEFEMEQTIALAYQVVDVESVTVAAGTFDALKINQAISLQQSMSGVAQSVPAITLNSTIWFAEGVGLVKSETQLPQGSAVVQELTSYTIP
jgi:hypothetical protein